MNNVITDQFNDPLKAHYLKIHEESYSSNSTQYENEENNVPSNEYEESDVVKEVILNEYGNQDDNQRKV